MTTRSREIEEVAEDRLKVEQALESTATEVKNGFIEDYDIDRNCIQLTIRSGSDRYLCEEKIVENGEKSEFVVYLEKKLDVDIKRPDGLIGAEVKIVSHNCKSKMIVQSEHELRLIKWGFLEYDSQTDGQVALTPRNFRFMFGLMGLSHVGVVAVMLLFPMSPYVAFAIGAPLILLSAVPVSLSLFYNNNIGFDVQTVESS